MIQFVYLFILFSFFTNCFFSYFSTNKKILSSRLYIIDKIAGYVFVVILDIYCNTPFLQDRNDTIIMTDFLLIKKKKMADFLVRIDLAQIKFYHTYIHTSSFIHIHLSSTCQRSFDLGSTHGHRQEFENGDDVISCTASMLLLV